MQETKRAKNKMYLEACFQQRAHFYPFVVSVDRLLGVEATATLKRIASCLATKWRQPYSQMCGYIKSRVAITLVQSTHRCIWGVQGAGASNRLPAPAVGRRLRAKPIHVSASGYPKPNQSLHPIPTP